MAAQSDDEFIQHVVATTNASLKQIRELLRKHDGNHKAVLKDARKVKAKS